MHLSARDAEGWKCCEVGQGGDREGRRPRLDRVRSSLFLAFGFAESFFWLGRAVVTTQYADWAIASPPASHAQLSSTPIRFTLSRVSHKLLVRAEDSSNPLLFRRDVNGFFDGIEAGEVRIGVMACQPGEERKGVKCRFEEFEFAFAS